MLEHGWSKRVTWLDGFQLKLAHIQVIFSNVQKIPCVAKSIWKISNSNWTEWSNLPLENNVSCIPVLTNVPCRPILTNIGETYTYHERFCWDCLSCNKIVTCDIQVALCLLLGTFYYSRLTNHRSVGQAEKKGMMFSNLSGPTERRMTLIFLYPFPQSLT